ncbi:unnamed protein product [Cuscuta europaea]|uniref:MATH domain-containing protein n=1 Tax=Cuscuta europaea TaxID=41803 RepID=A0A9P0YJM9_CUSEU|nr:unnamed protein product [Cuscuta europaea]CAH9060959.1 unnamed protein product [Cuscuta europaea]
MGSTTGVGKWKRDTPPSDFIFMIRSFSQLSQSGIEKLESGVFQTCDKKWKLCVHYHKGNKKAGDEDDDGRISLYLQMVETESLPRGWEVHAKFSLFVYDQVNDNYLTVQDGGGKVRRFHYMKTKWGLDELLPLSTFTNPSNGYLVDDTCAFGAEIFVLPNSTKRECHSIVVNKDPEQNIHTWKVSGFSSIKTEFITSNEFLIEGIKWTLRLYPKGYSTAKGQSLSLYMALTAAEDVSNNLGTKLFAKYKFRICNQLNAQHHESSSVEHVFDDPKGPFYGSHKCMPLKMLESTSGGFLVNDTLVVQVEFLLLSRVSDF